MHSLIQGLRSRDRYQIHCGLHAFCSWTDVELICIESIPKLGSLECPRYHKEVFSEAMDQ